jgi:2-polyprenyl-3-methyl-5-hydroxy-6-metoxy-1,4-benzoquinol methylase
MSEVEQAADWDRQWDAEPLDLEGPSHEQATPRWRAQERLVVERFGGFSGLNVIEIGSGRGTNAFLYGQRGARVTLLDRSEVALEQASQLFSAHGVEVEMVVADLFELPGELLEAFDVSMSFGLCEHFLGDRRLGVVRAHLELLRPGGVAMLGVPNRWGIVYRAWIKALMVRGSWQLGTEVPFSLNELRSLARVGGGEPLEATYGSFVASVVNHGVNQALFKLHRPGLPIPQVSIPIVDRLGYELLLPVLRPDALARR